MCFHALDALCYGILLHAATCSPQSSLAHGWHASSHCTTKPPSCVLLMQTDLPAGFVSFVLKLRKKYYLYQFGQYAWTHLILLFVFVPSSFFVSNIFDGIIWFLLPCSLVIINDIGAYLAGRVPTTSSACVWPVPVA